MSPVRGTVLACVRWPARSGVSRRRRGKSATESRATTGALMTGARCCPRPGSNLLDSIPRRADRTRGGCSGRRPRASRRAPLQRHVRAELAVRDVVSVVVSVDGKIPRHRGTRDRGGSRRLPMEIVMSCRYRATASPAWKACVRESVPRVRISPHPFAPLALTTCGGASAFQANRPLLSVRREPIANVQRPNEFPGRAAHRSQRMP